MEAQQSTENKPKSPALKWYLRRCEARGVPTPERERDLARKAHQGSRAAAEALVDANLPHVVKLAGQYEGLGLGLVDLIAEGTVGLFKAVRTYDEREDGRFTPYALCAARERIRTAVRV